MTLLLVLITGCAQPTHLQYDFGRAYYTSLKVQADLARPSVAEAMYPLSGAEATEIRMRQEEATGEEKSGKQEATAE